MVIVTATSHLPPRTDYHTVQRLLCITGILALLIGLAAAFAPAHTPDFVLPQGGSPLAFVPNQGQYAEPVRYAATTSEAAIFFTDQAVVVGLNRANASPANLTLRFDGASDQAQPSARDQLPGVVNQITGNDTANWRIGLPTYQSVLYESLYPGITLQYAGQNGSLKSAYYLAAGAEPAMIRWHYSGAEAVTLDPTTGDLHIQMPGDPQPLIEHAPIAWQGEGSQRVPVPIQYAMHANGRIGFTLGHYNRSLPLVIDPTLELSTYLGGSGADRIMAVAVDPATGDIFVAGETSSAAFPGSPTSVGQTSIGTFPNLFVARVSADGSGTVYRTIIGGTNTDEAIALAVEAGVASVTGTTYSTDFPTLNGFDNTYNGDADMFVLQLDAAGALTYGSFLGGPDADSAAAIVVDGSLVTVAGSTEGISFGSPLGGTDALVVQIDTSLGAPNPVYATRLGGFFTDTAYALARDPAGNMYVTGQTRSSGALGTLAFPTTPGAFQTSSASGTDGFLARLAPDGALTYGSFVGGDDVDSLQGLALAGNQVYLTGFTYSTNFPGNPGTPAGQDAFVLAFTPNTNAIAFSRLLGSPGIDTGRAIALDADQAAYVVGSTSSSSFFSLNPLAEMASAGGNTDAFVTRFAADGLPSYSTRLGGASNDYATGVATVQTALGARIYVAGYTSSSDFPQTTPPTSIQPSNGGGDDGFLVRIGNTRPVVDLNDADTANGINYGPVTFTESVGGMAAIPVSIVAETGLTVSDTDSPLLTYAEVRFVESQATAATAITPPDGTAESLTVTLAGPITGSYNSATGILRLTASGGATLANFQTVLRSLRYTNTAENPTAGTRLVAVEISDGLDRNTPLAFSSVVVEASNDAPVINLPSETAPVNEEGSLTIDGISVNDPDLGSGAIQVSLSVASGTGTLSLTPGSATVTGNGTSSLTIAGSLTEVNAALATLEYTGALDFNGIATLDITADDQGNSPAPAQTTSDQLFITVDPVNDAPVAPAGRTITVVEDGTRTVDIVADLGVTDAKDTTPPAAPGATALLPLQSLTQQTAPTNGTLGSFNTTNGTFVYTPTANAQGSDSFSYTVCDQGTPGSACATQTVTVTITPVNDPPSFTAGGDVTVAEDTSYSAPWATNLSAGPNESNQTLTFSILTNSNTGLFSSGPTISSNGTLSFTPALNATGVATITVRLQDNGGGTDTATPDATFTITVTPANDPPTINSNPLATSYTENGSPVLVDSGFTVSDSDSSDFDGGALSVSVTGNADTGDTLTILAGNGVSVAAGVVSYNGNPIGTLSGGTAGTALTISLTGVDATPAAVQAVLRQIEYSNTLDSFAAGATTTKSLQITVNDGDGGTSTGQANRSVAVAGVNDAPVLDNSGSMTLNTTPENASPNTGTLVSAIIASAGFDAITDVDTGAVEGLAITSVTNTNGTWEYSINNGTSWNAFTGLSSDNAILLNSSARIRFVPTVGFTGTVTDGISFVAWDSTSGVNGASADPTPGGTTSAFSLNSETASITITDVNFAPVLDNTGSMSMASIDEDIANSANTGTLVSAIIASAGFDAITDVDTGAVEGIAVIGVDPLNGSWEFSIDGGATWQTLGSPSGTAAVLLAADANTRIRFVPNSNFSGTVPNGLTLRAWDRTSGSNGQVGVVATSTGGTTALSTAFERVAITVNSVNDLPTAVDDTVNFQVNTTNNLVDVLANDSNAPDTDETLVVSAVGSSPNATITIAVGGTGVLYTPAPGFQGDDSFSYTISDGNNGSATATVNVRVGPYRTFAPVTFGNPIPPDLVITSFSVSPAGPNYTDAQQVVISVTVKNTGTDRTNGFYVDVYMEPRIAPTTANQRWDTLCKLNPCYGIAWLVENGLAGGESVTLTSTVDSFDPQYTRWFGSFARGTTKLYAYADSWNGTVPTGAVEESDETNNRAEITGLNVGPMPGAARTTAPAALEPLPATRQLPGQPGN